MSKITLASLRKSSFPQLYEKLLLEKGLNDIENECLLELAVLFLNASDLNVQALGYRIILRYCNLHQDYIPLYDVAINKGFIPIAKAIERTLTNERGTKSFFREFQSAYKEGFRQADIYLTAEQLDLTTEVTGDAGGSSAAIIAPTSYGKSELILDSLRRSGTNICILVPTKALVAQTKRRILNSSHYTEARKIITHPEMYASGDEDIVVVVTQERLLRLLQQEPTLAFDLVFVDEAHNLLEDDERGRLLASVIIILQNRSPRTVFRFLTPFLINHLNLTVRHTSVSLRELRISEHIKSERLFCYDFRGNKGLLFYDHFLDAFIECDEEYETDIGLIVSKKSEKNIVYANKPRHTEKIARRLAEASRPAESAVIARACRALAQFVHKDYFLIECLKNGIVYHHGSVPDIIKLYIEHLFSATGEINFIVTTSTLLEGVNIPAKRLFMLDYKRGRSRLTPSQFKNLIGRVCRLKEIFDPASGNLTLLEPEIYLIASDYISANANISTFLQGCMKVGRKESDDPENVLLVSTELPREKHKARVAAEEFLENVEQGSVKGTTVRLAKTDFGRSCFSNSIHEIDILACEIECQKIVDRAKAKGSPATDADTTLELFSKVFLPYVEDGKNIKRLEQEQTRAFYSMFLNWRIENTSFNEMIANFLHYWKRRESADPLVYVGTTWGDVKREDAHLELWVDITKKSPTDRVNLAIVRIKEEHDFLDNILIKFIEVLFDLELIVPEFYDKICYGTDDLSKIELMKSGLSAGLAGLLLKKYATGLRIDRDSGKIEILPSVREAMLKNGENEIMIFEFDCNVRPSRK